MTARKQPSGWRLQLVIPVITAVVSVTLTYWVTLRLDRTRHLDIQLQADRIRAGAAASAEVARLVSASLGAADHILRALQPGASPAELDAGRERWNAADSAWIGEKIALSNTMDAAITSDDINAAWSRMDSTVNRLGVSLGALVQESASGRRPAATSIGAASQVRDSTQAALLAFLGAMREGLARR